MDPARADDLTYALALVHPILMSISLILCALALRIGVQMRNLRRHNKPKAPGSRRGHLRLAKTGLIIGALGALLGPPSSVWLRGWPVMDSFHGWVGAVTVALAVVVVFLGRRLELALGKPLNPHAILGMLAMLVGLLAAVTGLELLP